MNDDELARDIALRTGALLLDLRREGALKGRALGDEGDARANALICSALAAARSDDGLLSEERADDGQRMTRRRVWIVDPLDGTREYGEGRDDWAVHIGLAVDGVATIGAVALPALGLVMTSNPPPAPTAPARPPRMLVSRTRPPQIALDAAAMMGAELIPMGSAGAKAMAVARGMADIYLHAGGQYEWDNCAPVAVAQAAGLHVSRIDGTPLVYNQRDVSLPDLVICHPYWAPALMNALSTLRER